MVRTATTQGTMHVRCVVEYFDNADALYTHIRNRHHFECTICYDVSHTAEDLDEHIKEKHGGSQPSEQEIQAQRRMEQKVNVKNGKRQRPKQRPDNCVLPVQRLCGRIQHENRTGPAYNGQTHLHLW